MHTFSIITWLCDKMILSQLLTALNYWTEFLEQGIPVDVIYLDFSKAFDSVSHERLLLKLKAYGIHGNILEWIKSFLSGKKQTVVVNGVKSVISDVLSTRFSNGPTIVLNIY